jgi:hypothetical protein
LVSSFVVVSFVPHGVLLVVVVVVFFLISGAGVVVVVVSLLSGVVVVIVSFFSGVVVVVVVCSWANTPATNAILKKTANTTNNAFFIISYSFDLFEKT